MIKGVILSFFLFSSPLFSKEEKNFYKDWSLFLGDFSEALTGISDSQTLTQLLFNSFSDISAPVYTFDTPQLPVDIGFGVDVGGGRKVIYNARIDNSYTVIDKFLVGIRPEFLGVWSGIKGGVRSRINFFVTNVRQIGPTAYDRLLPFDKIYEDLKEKFRIEKLRKYTPEEIQADNDTYSQFMPSGKEKVERNATFGRIWNPLTMGFRLPLSPNAAQRLAPNEILGYTLLGGIELAGGFGVSLDPTGQVLRTGVDASVYFKGTYEVVVLRERPSKQGDNFVRVRLGRHKGVGYQLGMGSEGYSGLDDFTKGHVGPLEGNFIWGLAGYLVTVRPFRIEWDQSYWWLFNQVYRFDLNNPDARRAYQKAVLGSFKEAQKLALDEKGQFRENAPVTRILTEKEKRQIKGHRNSIKLFLFSLQKDGVIRKSDIVLIDEKSQEHHFLEVEALSSRYWNFLFAVSEERSHKFLITVDLKEFQKENKKPEAMTLIVDVEHNDTQTTTREYNDYVNEVESAINKKGFFPSAPIVAKKDRFKPKVGRVSFYYQIKFQWQQIEKLINYPEEKMWSAMITAFNAQNQGWEDPKIRKKLIAKAVGIYAGTLPVTLVGSKFPPKDNIIIASIKINLWLNLKDAFLRGPKDLSEALGKFFKSGDYGPEMVKLLRIVCDGDQVPYKLKVFNPLFGDNPNLFEDEIGDIRKPLDTVMDTTSDLYQGDFEKMSVGALVAELVSNEYIRLSFDLDKNPQSLFFNLQKINFFGGLTNVSLGSITIQNKNNIFKKGRNIIMVKLGDNRHPLNKLFNQMEVKKSLRMPNQYRIDIAGSLDGKKYGFTFSDLFRLIYMEDSKALNKYIKYTMDDFNLCIGKTAMNLMLLLGDQPFMVCPETAPHNPDGTCVSGMYPYDYFKNRPLAENLVKRDSWILKNCPVEGNEEFIKSTVAQNNVCLGKNASQLISFLGDRILFVCPPSEARNPDGTCITGLVPYKIEEGTNNNHSRNEWIIKYCPK